jgi:hypothetical protein
VNDTPEYSVNISRDQAREFLERLAHDDDFRNEFEDDAQAVLGKYGITIPASAVPRTVKAPPRHYLEEVLWALHLDEVASAGVHVPFSPPVPFAVPFALAPFSGGVPFFHSFGPLCESIYQAIWRAR